MKKNFKAKDVSTYVLAGWLFADLLLGLSMILLGSGDNTPLYTPTYYPTYTIYPTLSPYPTSTYYPSWTPVSTATFYSTYTPSPTFTPYPTLPGESGPPGLGFAQCYNIQLESRIVNHTRIINELTRLLPNSTSSRAGLVLVWTHGESIGEGVTISKVIGNILKREFSHSFGNAVIKSLGFSSGKQYLVQLEVYFFTTAPWDSIWKDPCLYNQ